MMQRESSLLQETDTNVKAIDREEGERNVGVGEGYRDKTYRTENLSPLKPIVIKPISMKPIAIKY
jgi:hypothetical protein